MSADRREWPPGAEQNQSTGPEVIRGNSRQSDCLVLTGALINDILSFGIMSMSQKRPEAGKTRAAQASHHYCS